MQEEVKELFNIFIELSEENSAVLNSLPPSSLRLKIVFYTGFIEIFRQTKLNDDSLNKILTKNEIEVIKKYLLLQTHGTSSGYNPYNFCTFCKALNDYCNRHRILSIAEDRFTLLKPRYVLDLTVKNYGQIDKPVTVSFNFDLRPLHLYGNENEIIAQWYSEKYKYRNHEGSSAYAFLVDKIVNILFAHLVSRLENFNVIFSNFS